MALEQLLNIPAWASRPLWSALNVLVVVLRAKEFVDQFLLKHEFIKRLLVHCKQEGITIPNSRFRLSA